MSEDTKLNIYKKNGWRKEEEIKGKTQDGEYYKEKPVEELDF